MTQEEKQLLFKDLCARLPYGVKILYTGWDNDRGFEYQVVEKLVGVDDHFIYTLWGREKNKHSIKFADFKPYLRPMSSMTEEEAFEMFYTVLPQFSLIGVDIESDRFRFKRVDSDGHFAGFTILFFDRIYSLEQFDWLNSHHFDYRGLIDKGLALEAPEDMYKTE